MEKRVYSSIPAHMICSFQNKGGFHEVYAIALKISCELSFLNLTTVQSTLSHAIQYNHITLPYQYIDLCITSMHNLQFPKK